MKIEEVTTYIVHGKAGATVVSIGNSVRLIFRDGTYLKGDIEDMTEESVTISRSDGDHTYRANEVQDIEIYG